MLRGATAAPPPALEAEVQPHNTRVLQTRHSGVYGPQTLPSEPCDEPSPKPIVSPVTNSINSGTSSTYRQHQRQQSAPSFAARRPNAPSLPPPQGQNNTKRYSQGMPLTGDGRGGNSPGRHGGWRSGTSTPPGIEHDASPFPRQPRTPVDTTPKSTAQQSRFGFLASSVSAFTSRMTSPAQQAPTARTDDELCDLDIEAALYPPTPLSPLDGGDSSAFSPAAYKNLQANATGLLHRMQDAYRQQTAALRQLQAEREAQAEEAEEMEMRTRNFRAQLEAMAAKAAEQEKEMQRLVAELQAERRERARYNYNHGHGRVGEMMAGEVEGEGEETSAEDLCVDEDDRKRWRASNSTVKSDLSIDTDGFDSVPASVESESLFSRSRSPTATCATSTETDSVLDMPPPSALLHPRAAAGTAKLSKSTPQQLTTFQRLVKGISPGGGENGGGVDGCRNCRGQDASVAWDTVSLLRDENIALKQRVAQLDVVIEGALDVVNGFKI
ncbi:hypothetical protein F4678DRAFT_461716 [Xylaria arbuscula]|nr:hypothetical protein F4678DRAFT_461716 [Xylaria arbuscula]